MKRAMIVGAGNKCFLCFVNPKITMQERLVFMVLAVSGALKSNDSVGKFLMHLEMQQNKRAFLKRMISIAVITKAVVILTLINAMAYVGIHQKHFLNQ